MSLILFSPIGGTDPMSLTNFQDGSMLHIARVYKPDQIYLYLSAEMIKVHETDNRFLYSLEKLFELQGREPAKIELVKRPELDQVQEFNFFYSDFQIILHSIMQQMKEDDELLLNISSGTPAMKSALLVIATLREFPCKVIQVTTPERKMNEHKHVGYDVKTCWELNPDNNPGFENRTHVVECPALSQIQTENNIRRHVLSYDYHAAVRIADSLPEERKAQYLDYLLMAAARYDLDHSAVCELSKKTDFNCYPFTKAEDRRLFEFLLSIQVRLKRREYADFVRAITPAVLYLFIGIINCNTNLDMKKLIEKYKDGTLKWNTLELINAKVYDIVFEKGNAVGKLYLKSNQLLDLLKSKCSDKQIVVLAEKLRSIEETIRNRVAHDIICVTDQVIIKKAGESSADIMEMLKKACGYAGIAASDEQWNSYDLMNEKILEMMDK